MSDVQNGFASAITADSARRIAQGIDNLGKPINIIYQAIKDAAEHEGFAINAWEHVDHEQFNQHQKDYILAEFRRNGFEVNTAEGVCVISWKEPVKKVQPEGTTHGGLTYPRRK